MTSKVYLAVRHDAALGIEIDAFATRAAALAKVCESCPRYADNPAVPALVAVEGGLARQAFVAEKEVAE